MDEGGMYGSALHYALVIFFAGSTSILFIYFWVRGQLDMDEAPKFQMLEEQVEEEHGERRAS